MLTQVFLEVVVHQFKNQVELLLRRDVDNFSQSILNISYWTMLGWGCNSLSMEISLMAVEGTPSS